MTKRCPKCQSPMTEGVIIDKDQHVRRVSSWLEGAPVMSMWGLGLKLRGKKPIPIQTWRCDRCSFLESYASG